GAAGRGGQSRVLRAGRLPGRHLDRAVRRRRRGGRGGGVPLLGAGLGGDRCRATGRRRDDQSGALMSFDPDIEPRLSRLVAAYAAAVDARDLEALRRLFLSEATLTVRRGGGEP